MTILSIYSQQDQCSVALKGEGGVFQDSIILQNGETQATALVSFIQKVWQQAKSAPLTVIITPRGPGAFTSLRVTLATAQGLAAVFPKATIFAPTHFEVLAYAGIQKTLATPDEVLALIDSKRGDWYAQLYPANFPENLPSQPPLILNNDSLKELLTANPSYKIVADFKIPEEFEKYIVDDLGNISAAQISLYEAFLTKGQLDHSYNELKPYYFYQPNYVKKRNISAVNNEQMNG